MKKRLIVANWKMYITSPKEAQALFAVIKGVASKLRHVEVVVAPPALFLPVIAQGYGGSKVAFAAQGVSVHESGAHTGSLSAAQFAASGARYALVGHSERRTDEGMTQDGLRLKTFLALKYGLTPIVFIGERERDSAGRYLEVLKGEILATLTELPASKLEEVIFCYEPVWAIGKDDILDAYEIHQMALFIRKVLLEHYGSKLAQNARVFYGGSVNPENISEVLAISDIDGAVIGRASSDAVAFTELLTLANK